VVGNGLDGGSVPESGGSACFFKLYAQFSIRRRHRASAGTGGKYRDIIQLMVIMIRGAPMAAKRAITQLTS
jgi:hypothetical protein